MTEQKLFAPELKPWESNLKDPRLAPSSYAAGAVFGLVELAMETIHGSGSAQDPALIREVVKTFARVLIKVQVEVGSGGGWESSLNTRLRGALRTALILHPMPEGVESISRLDDWEGLLYAQVLRVAKAAAWLYTLTPEQLEAS